MFIAILFSFLTFASTHFVVNQDGGWTPWQRDGYIDCCVWGDFAKFKRYCQNPYPEGSGKICNSTANPQGAMEEEEWGTCTCGCSKPSCDNVGHTTFCVNDTWRPAYCECKPGLVRPDQWDPFEDPQICVIPPNITDITPTPAADTDNSSLIEAFGFCPWIKMDTKNHLDLALYISICWMLAWIAAITLVFFCYCNLMPDRLLHMNEEFCLGITYLFVMLFSESTSDETICRITSIVLHYFFLATLAFFCLEALHTYSLVTYVVPANGFFNRAVNVFMGYLIPAIVVGTAYGIWHDAYGTGGCHCWCNFGTSQAWAVVFPVAAAAFIGTVISEAQGQGNYESLTEADKQQLASAKVSEHSMVWVMLLAVVSYCFGMIAVDKQSVVMYALFYTTNFILGPLIFWFHCTAHPLLYEKFHRAAAMMCPCFQKKHIHHNRPATAATMITPSISTTRLSPEGQEYVETAMDGNAMKAGKEAFDNVPY